MLHVFVARHPHYVEKQSVVYSEAAGRVELSGIGPASLASAIFHEPSSWSEAGGCSREMKS